MDNETLTVEQAAVFLQVSDKTVLRALRTGKIPGAKVGGQWRLSRRLLEQYLAGEWQPTQSQVAGRRA